MTLPEHPDQIVPKITYPDPYTYARDQAILELCAYIPLNVAEAYMTWVEDHIS